MSTNDRLARLYVRGTFDSLGSDRFWVVGKAKCECCGGPIADKYVLTEKGHRKLERIRQKKVIAGHKSLTQEK